MIAAYQLPTEVACCDISSFSVYHQIDEVSEEASFLRFGYSKDHRPDLRQYCQLLGTLDSAGISTSIPDRLNALIQICATFRLKHHSPRPGRSYLYDIKDFLRYHGMRSPCKTDLAAPQQVDTLKAWVREQKWGVWVLRSQTSPIPLH